MKDTLFGFMRNLTINPRKKILGITNSIALMG